MSTESHCGTDIIIWPSDLMNGNGWIIGWRLGHIMLVAGRLPHDLIDFQQISNKIDSLRRNTCFCCSCEEEKGTVCGGCTRKLCFETIEVIAYSSRNNLSKRSNKAGNAIPLLQMSPNGIPLYFSTEESSSCSPFRQVVLYESCLTGSEPDKELRLQDIVLYSSPITNSTFSRDILGRMTHASAVVRAILLPESSSSLSDSVGPPAEDGRIEGYFDLIHKRLALIPFKSYFIDHVQRENPLLKTLRLVVATFRTKAPRSGYVWCGQCEKRYHALTKSHHAHIDQSISSLNDNIRCSLDLATGIVWGLAVSFVARGLFRAFDFTKYVQAHFDWLRILLEWMEKFPIGFKLNVKLTVGMGNAARAFLRIQEVFVFRIFSAALYFLTTPFLPLVFGLIVGGSGMITLLCDVWRLVTLHFSVLAHAFHFLFSVEVFVLRSSWRLFRGKKRNILRQRTDTMNYDSTQLLFGTILFTAALFLFTTVLVYNVVFSALRILILFITRLLLTLHVMVYRFNWGSIWFRLSKRNWFTVGVHLVEVSRTQREMPGDNCDLTYLVPERMRVFALIHRDMLLQLRSFERGGFDAKR